MDPAGWEWPNHWHPREQDLIRFQISSVAESGMNLTGGAQ